ncbi:MAG TPA: LD-carboxypeptidase [Polyangiales bacterium]|jgi:muramoyltetrapeptide carboxypeptidase
MAPPRHFIERYVAPGAKIALIAPAGPFDRADFARGLARLRSHYDVHHDESIFDRDGYFAGDDARRSRELQDALTIRRADAIVAARGGYGAMRLLDRLDLAAIRGGAPLLVGFSDISALHALWAKASVGSIHGNMVGALGRASDALWQRWRDAIEGRFIERFDGLQTIREGAADGLLLGGNLAVLTALIGTPHFPPLTEAVLFLEDIGERPYRIDRMLTTWRQAGAFAGVRAIVLGAFVQGEAGPDGVRLEDVLAERLGDLGIPVASGLPAGHLDDNVELPFGRRVTLDASRGVLHLHPLGSVR